MFNIEGLKIYFYTVPVDMRCSIDRLSVIVVAQLELNPATGDLYIFFNKYRNKIKILYWQQNGFWLLYKRLERERFKVPMNEGVISLRLQQLRWILDGLDYAALKGHKALSYTTYV